MKISIIIPVYNEENTINTIINKIQDVRINDKEIVVIDDGSTDNSKSIINLISESIISKKIFLKKNYGKGYACRQGIINSTGDIIIIQDADLEYNPQDYYKLLDPILKNKAKVVYGSRVLTGGKRTRPNNIIIKLSKLSNYFLTYLSNFLNKQNLTDAHTCYKVFTREVIDNIELKESGFSFCPELTAKISKLNIKIQEVPIDYHGRSHKEGKKINILDGFKAIIAIIKYNF